MARDDTWGDIISRNYTTGRGIGNDIARTRFSRRAAKLKDEYEARAKSEGKNVEDYLPEIEQRLEELATKVGATRRNVRAEDGSPLSTDYARGLYTDLQRGAERRAGAMALAGDQAGARDTRARTQYAIGDFDAGQGQQIAGETIRATQGALRPDGTYDRAAGAQGLAGVGARYGNADSANAQQQGATTFRLQAAQAKADSLFNMVQNLDKFSPDQIAGAWEGFKANVPEMQNVDLRKGDDGMLYIYTGGKPSGSIDPKNQTDLQEVATMMSQFTKAPGESLQGYMGARLKSIEESKASDAKKADSYRAARIDVVKNLQASGLPADLAKSVVDAQQKLSSGGGGWQLQDIGTEPGTYLMQKNGKVYTIKTNVAPNLETGETGGAVQVFDGDGNPVPASALDRAETQQLNSVLVDLSAQVAASNYKLKTGVLRDQLRILNELEAQDRGLTSPGRAGGNSRADRNQNPGNIEDGAFARAQPGYKGSDGRFAIFDTPENGAAAQAKLLQSYGRRGFDTVAKIISRWSPQSDPTNQPGSTGNYAAYVAQQLGVAPDEQLDLSDPSVAARLATAMYQFESGNTQGTPSPVQRRTASAAPAAAAPARTVAQSAPATQSPLQRRAEITPDYVRGAGRDLMQLRQDYLSARDRLAQFDEDQGVEMGYVPGATNASVGGRRAINLTPTQQRVRARLESEVATAEEAMRGATGELRANTRALQRDTAGRSAQREEEALYSRYGGAADFLSRASQ